MSICIFAYLYKISDLESSEEKELIFMLMAIRFFTDLCTSFTVISNKEELQNISFVNFLLCLFITLIGV